MMHTNFEKKKKMCLSEKMQHQPVPGAGGNESSKTPVPVPASLPRMPAICILEALTRRCLPANDCATALDPTTLSRRRLCFLRSPAIMALLLPMVPLNVILSAFSREAVANIGSTKAAEDIVNSEFGPSP
jgi:hypothetical protein